MKRLLLVLIAFVLLPNAKVTAQSTNDLSLQLYGVLSLPSGEFAKDKGDHSLPTRRFGFDIGNEIGLAKTGFGGGVELMSSVWFKGLHWILSVNYLTNPANDAALESSYQAKMSNANQKAQVDLKLGNWINIPFLSGFRYDYPLSSGFTIYALIQGGMNFSRRPSQKAVVSITPTVGSSVAAMKDVLAEDTRYDFARDFGYGAGIGILFNQRFNLGVRYFNLSHPKFSGSRTLSPQVFNDIFARTSLILAEERSVSMTVITLGITLF